MELQRIIEQGSDTDWVDLFTPHSHNSDRLMAFGRFYHFNCHIIPLRVKLYTGIDLSEKPPSFPQEIRSLKWVE